ncbi:F-box protein CPR1 [Linum grandiflorum]
MANILLRLRVKDLVNCRRVSKQWLSIIDDPHFIRSQLECALSANSNSALFVKQGAGAGRAITSSPQFRVVYWKQQSNDDISSSFFSSEPTEYEPTRKLELIGSCHGLVCFSLLNYSHSPDFIILNPSTGERHQLTSNPSKEDDRLLRAYGFGYDESSDDYKVVRILETKRSDDYDAPNINPSYFAEICGVRSKDFFRTIPLDDSDWTNNDFGKSMGVFSGSSLHWITRRIDRVEHAIHIIDIVSNTYRRLHLLKSTFAPNWFLNLGIVDGRLCLCSFLGDGRRIGIWAMEEYWNFESWNKIYCIGFGQVLPYIYTLLLSADERISSKSRAKLSNNPKFLTMSSDLIPQEITADILLRLRVKDLVNCRRVSKQWLSIIDDPHFIRDKLGRSLSSNSSNSAILFLQNRISSKVHFWKQSHDIISSFFSTRYERSKKLEVMMGSCHGLVCFAYSDHPRANLRIINPSTGERHTLITNPSKEAGRRDYILIAFGFGYDELSDDYKVVRILETRSDHSYIAEIYGVRSNGFYRLPLPIVDGRDNGFRNFGGVFYGNSLHWCSWDNTVRQHAIHAIDIVSNTYRKLHLPETTFGNQIRCLNVGVVDRRLCLCGFHWEEGKIRIWVMEEYGNSESWNRIYCFQNRCLNLSPLSAITPVGSDGDKILLILDRHTFLWYDPTKSKVDETVIVTGGKDWNSYEAIFCLESLVKIFPNTVKKDTLAGSTLRNWLVRKFHRRIIRRPAAFLNLHNVKTRIVT